MNAISSTLFVREVPREEYSDLESVLGSWKEVALKKYDEGVESREESEIFIDSKAVIFAIETFLRNPIPQTKVLLCEDSDRLYEAVGLYSEDEDNITIDWLVTNPKNIKHPLNDLTQRVSGAATKIMEHIGFIAFARSIDVALAAYESAAPFYMKLGFEEEGRAKFIIMMIWRIDVIRTRLVAA